MKRALIAVLCIFLLLSACSSPAPEQIPSEAFSEEPVSGAAAGAESGSQASASAETTKSALDELAEQVRGAMALSEDMTVHALLESRDKSPEKGLLLVFVESYSEHDLNQNLDFVRNAIDVATPIVESSDYPLYTISLISMDQDDNVVTDCGYSLPVDPSTIYLVDTSQGSEITYMAPRDGGPLTGLLGEPYQYGALPAPPSSSSSGASAGSSGLGETSTQISGLLTKSAYDRLEKGMTFDEVCAIIGNPNEKITESGAPGERAHTVMYMWYGGSSLLSNASILFQDGKLLEKFQAGLDDTPTENPGLLTKAAYDQLEQGMSYDEVCAIIGNPNEKIAESGVPGEPDHTVMYMWYGSNSLISNASILFQGDKLLEKLQVGLE